MNTRQGIRTLIAAAAIGAAIFAQSADARGSHHHKHPSTTTSIYTGGSGYINSKGEWVPSPTKSTNGTVPAGASAQCADGTYSFSHSRRGTCSHHGGVASWQPSSPPP